MTTELQTEWASATRKASANLGPLTALQANLPQGPDVPEAIQRVAQLDIVSWQQDLDTVWRDIESL